MGVTYLKTDDFTATVNAFKSGVNEYNSIKSEVQRITNNVLMTWKGEGRKQFEKDYAIIFRQLEDIGDIMYELYDALIEAQATYVTTDEELSKQFTM